MTVTYIYKGYGITDENGKAHLEYDSSGNPLTHSYTGTGAGEIDIVASLDQTITDSSIISNTYTIEDCYFIEQGSSTTGYTISGGTLTITDGEFTLTKGTGTSYFYTNYPKTNYPITDFQDKTLTVKANLTEINATNLVMYLMVNTGSWSTATTTMTTTGTIENTIDIPSNATQVRIRFDINGSADDNVVFEDFRLLLD